MPPPMTKTLAPTGNELKFDRVLAVSDDQGFRLGKPMLDGASVSAEVLGVRQGIAPGA